MEVRQLGASGLSVSALGLGAGGLGGPDTGGERVDRLLGAALDAGVTLVDTAPSYGSSEERLGRALLGRRERVVLSTKVGYGVPGLPDWTGPCVAAGVDAALGRLRTDRLDVVHLHSCPLDVLARGEVVEALGEAVAAGKARVAAYSGEGAALEWAVRSGAFGAVQCSVSPIDQASLGAVLAEARQRGLGVIAKRALGNAPWRHGARPEPPDQAEAWERFGELRLDPAGLSWGEVFLRFSAHQPGVSSALVGTASPAHLAEAAAAVGRGPLEPERLEAIGAAWERAGRGWAGRI